MQPLHPGFPGDRGMTEIKSIKKKITPEEYRLLQRLRHRKPGLNPPTDQPTWGEYLADRVAAVVGSWRFILIQSAILILWILANVSIKSERWDPYPFILLNLMLSFQAAYAAPIIMMSQNRQASIDRADARNDYEVNQKTELELSHLQDKVDILRGIEIMELKVLLDEQRQQLLHLGELLRDVQAR